MKPLSKQIDQPLIDFAWRLWNTLGITGEGNQNQDYFIDLEALIILTAVIAKSDPRLFAEAIDWCSKYHTFVSVSRLRALVEELGPQVATSFSLFAATLNSVSLSKWPTMVKISPIHVKLSGKSQAPNCAVPALLVLRMRAFFGVGARADFVTFFLTHELPSLTVADTEKIGYHKRTLAEILDSFVESGILVSSKAKNQKRYEPAKKEQLANLAGEIPRIIPDWSSILPVLITLRETLLKHQTHSTSSKVVAIRNAADQLKEPLLKLGISIPPLSSDSAHWNSIIQWVVDTIKALTMGEGLREIPSIQHYKETFSFFMQHLYRVEDCIDGLEFIISNSTENPMKHQQVFKECYQMSVCYLEELQSRLDDLFAFPIYLLNDVQLSEIFYKFNQEELPTLHSFVQSTPASTEVTMPGIALHWHKKLEVHLNKTHRLLYTIKERLKELHFHKTNIHLLTNPLALHKRHAILKIFSSNSL